MTADAAPRSERRIDTAPLWIVPPLLAVVAVFFYPLALIVRQAATDADGHASLAPALDTLTSAYFLRALLNTCGIALAATALCLVLGFVLALVLSFVPFPGARIVARVIDSIIALPTFLVTLAFTFLYGSSGILNASLVAAFDLGEPPIHFLYSAAGVVLAEATVFTPFVLRPLMAAFSLLDLAQIEAASSLGAKPLRIVRRVILPAALPALLAGGSLCLLLTVNEFGIVLFIGAKGVVTLPLLVYDKAIQESDYTGACAVAVVSIILSLALFALYRGLVAVFGSRRARLV